MCMIYIQWKKSWEGGGGVTPIECALYSYGQLKGKMKSKRPPVICRCQSRVRSHMLSLSVKKAKLIRQDFQGKNPFIGM